MADHTHRGGDAHLQDDDHNWFPERTIPQGTQENGVDFQHEGRDANLRSIINWFAALAAMVAVVIVLLYGAFQLLLKREQAADALPSPIFAQQQVPPEPRLIPTPFRARHEGEALQGPVEYREEYEARERAILLRDGLLDAEKGSAKLPDDTPSVVQELNKGAAPAAGTPDQGVTDHYPSDMSGGIVPEDRLR